MGDALSYQLYPVTLPTSQALLMPLQGLMSNTRLCCCVHSLPSLPCGGDCAGLGMWAPGFINGDATAWGTTVSNITLALTFSPTPTPVKVWTFFLANAEKGDFINLLVPTTGSVSPPILHLSVPTMVHSSHLRWKSVGPPVSASVLPPPRALIRSPSAYLPYCRSRRYSGRWLVTGAHISTPTNNPRRSRGSTAWPQSRKSIVI